MNKEILPSMYCTPVDWALVGNYQFHARYFRQTDLSTLAFRLARKFFFRCRQTLSIEADNSELTHHTKRPPVYPQPPLGLGSVRGVAIGR